MKMKRYFKFLELSKMIYLIFAKYHYKIYIKSNSTAQERKKKIKRI